MKTKKISSYVPGLYQAWLQSEMNLADLSDKIDKVLEAVNDNSKTFMRSTLKMQARELIAVYEMHVGRKVFVKI